MELLHDFLTAKEELKSGQLCLFPFYDFNIIPIELISNIYEILLGREKQNRDKAFYTPCSLASHIIDETVGEYLIDHQECKVLDPACGSGIFLVQSLQRILEKNADSNGFVKDKDALRSLLTDNIYGVDLNEEAVDVTIFSLYITLLDHINPKDLPTFQLPLLKEENIFVKDFFDEDFGKEEKNPFHHIRFQFILGNPPWGKVNQSGYRNYGKAHGIKIPDLEICVAFLMKAIEIGKEDTVCSFIIPSKILYKRKKPSVEFRKFFLENVCIKQVFELSAVRREIFEGAIAPASILTFVCKKASVRNKIEYISLKPNNYGRSFGIFMINPEDVKYIRQKQLMEHDGLWRSLVYGDTWDQDLLLKLDREFPSIKEIEAQHELLTRRGLQDNIGDANDASHLIGRKILDSNRAIDHFYLNEKESSVFQREKINRPRDPIIFEAPYVLFKKGLDCSDLSIRAVYSETDLLYRDTISCIKGSMDDRKILLNLCGLLNSSLFSYFTLMCGSSAGIEREQIFFDEVKEYPYAYSDKLVKLVEEIQENGYTKERKQELDQCVLEMYGLQKEPFVDYALHVQIPVICGNYMERVCTKNDMETYVSVFLQTWENHFRNSGVYCLANVIMDIKGKFTGLQIKLSFRPFPKRLVYTKGTDENIRALTKLNLFQISERLYQSKDILYFTEDSFLILKSNASRNWHPAFAVKDAHKVIHSILLSEEDENEKRIG